MLKKIKNSVLSVMLLLTLVIPGAVSITIATAVAATSSTGCGTGGVSDQVAGGASTASGPNQSITCSPTGSSDSIASNVGTLAAEVVNIFSVIVGAASIVMIIYGGFRYITSGGSTDRVGSAKNTIIYAIVGLIIVALAQTLVHFVLSRASGVGNSVT